MTKLAGIEFPALASGCGVEGRFFMIDALATKRVRDATLSPSSPEVGCYVLSDAVKTADELQGRLYAIQGYVIRGSSARYSPGDIPTSEWRSRITGELITTKVRIICETDHADAQRQSALATGLDGLKRPPWSSQFYYRVEAAD